MLHYGIRFCGVAALCCIFSLVYSQTVGSEEEPVIDILVDDSVAVQKNATQQDSLMQPDTMPVLTTFIEAAYPPSLIKKGIVGTVVLEMLVNETGNVDSVSVQKGLHPVLDSSAVAAARKFVFSPAKAGGVPVAVLLHYAYTFSLDNAIDSIPQVINFSGRCIERGTKRPIPDAVISIVLIDSAQDTTLPLPFTEYLKKICDTDRQILDNNHIVVNSNENGQFVYRSLPACSLRVTVIVPGYAAFSTREKIRYNEELQVTYYIERHSYNDYEVVVYGKAEEKEVSRRQLTVNEIRRIPGFGGDAIKAIQAFPGVSRTIVGSGEIIVRGSPTWDSRFFLDGMEIPQLYHFGDVKSTYNSDGLAAVDFLPGGFGTRCGGAIAGVVELRGRKGSDERIKGAIETSTLDGSVFVEGPVTDSVTVLANVRRSFIGDVLQQVVKAAPEQFPFTMYPYYWDYLVRTDYASKRHGSFYLSLFGSRDSLSFIFPEMRFGSEEISEEVDRLGMNTTFHTGVIGWDWAISKQLVHSLKYNLMSIHWGFSSPFSKNEQDVIVNHLRDQLVYTVNPFVKVTLGADMQLSLLDLKLIIPSSSGMALTMSKNNWLFGDVAGYCNVEWRPMDKVLLIPGVRYDYYPELDYNGGVVPAFWNYHSFDNDRGFSGEPSLRMNGRYTLTEKHTAKFAIGTYNQSPEPMGQAVMKEWGDPHMPATKAAHYVTGYEWQINDLVDMDVQAYLNRQWDIPRWVSDDELTEDAVDQSKMRHNGIGRMYGMELMVRHQQGKRFFGWMAYTLSRTERFSPVRKKWTIYGQDETHYLQLVGSWRLPRNWETGFHIKFASGKPTTRILGIDYEDENSTMGAEGIVPKWGTVNGDRMEPAFQLDLRVDKKIIFKKYLLLLYADLQNIGYFVYKTTDQWIWDDFYDERQGFSMFPLFAIGARYEF